MRRWTLILLLAAVVGCESFSQDSPVASPSTQPAAKESTRPGKLESPAPLVVAPGTPAPAPLVTSATPPLVVVPVASTDEQLSANRVAREEPPAAAVAPSEEKQSAETPPAPVEPERPWLGVSRWLANDREVVLLGVLADGPAGKAGLVAGDALMSIQGQSISSLIGLESALGTLKPTDTVLVEIDRRGERRQVDVALEPLPADRGIARIREAADAGHAWAMCELGLRYALMEPTSAGVTRDLEEGVQWFRRALDAGYPLAPLFLGIMTLEGRGTKANIDEARRLLILARETQGAGVPRGLPAAASYQLAVMCLRGQGTEQDTTSALRFFRDAAEQGSLAAMQRIGTMFELGLGVAQDDVEAARWYHKAAKLGYQPAQQSIVELATSRKPGLAPAQPAASDPAPTKQP